MDSQGDNNPMRILVGISHAKGYLVWGVCGKTLSMSKTLYNPHYYREPPPKKYPEFSGNPYMSLQGFIIHFHVELRDLIFRNSTNFGNYPHDGLALPRSM